MNHAKILMSAFIATLIFLAGCEETSNRDEFPCPMNVEPDQAMPEC